MDEEICTVFAGNGALDDDYTFYASGKIKRVYDQSLYKLNVEAWTEPSHISDSKKQKILSRCDPEFRERIEQILSNR